MLAIFDDLQKSFQSLVRLEVLEQVLHAHGLSNVCLVCLRQYVVAQRQEGPASPSQRELFPE